ncbi:MAG TPA: iron dependent repressor, metal binding and dimerization domain protein, partial [Longimicrobiales bacterium]|nr:iron dependent repressor, metal binding and dimerization domain protein [Longimicrobiales bacterium]
FWPHVGLVPRFLRLRRLDERVRLEDALKHVYMCERRGQPCTLESLAGQLEVSTARAATILTHLAHLELVEAGGVQPTLTPGGRASALRVVRTHRMWERYLADRTGLPAGEWHDEAERVEHTLTPEAVDDLDRRLGHPRWDPHGDPIPTSEGEIPPLRGHALLQAETGTVVEVVHLEDEPRAIYDALVAHGLAPGGRLEILDVSPRRVRVRTEGREWDVDAVSARNVTVHALPSGERADEARETLLDAPMGEAVRVLGLSSSCQGTQRRRLLDLGVVRGTEIVPELVSAAGDPVAYRIRGALIALRREQASWIGIERIPREEVA